MNYTSRIHHFTFLYETVLFTNASSGKIKVFLYHFNYNEIDGSIGKFLKNNLKKKSMKILINKKLERYVKKSLKGKIFSPSENQPFSSILNYIRNNSKK